MEKVVNNVHYAKVMGLWKFTRQDADRKLSKYSVS